MQNHLRKKLELEKAKLEVLRAQEPADQVSSHESEGEVELDREQLRELCDQLVQENERLEKENEKIIENINEERQLLVEANIAYRVKNEIQNCAWYFFLRINPAGILSYLFMCTSVKNLALTACRE